MKAFSFLESQTVFIEIGQSSLRVLDRGGGLELPLERLENGRLNGECRARVTQALRNYLGPRRSWLSRTRACCAIGARGVSLRNLTLPASAQEELPRLVSLQIESQFPLPPDELAWGYQRLVRENLPRSAATGTQELLVAAVKKEVIQDYAEVLSGCNLSPIFTLGALARSTICPPFPGACASLDIGRNHSELVTFEGGVPTQMRILSWGGEDITRALAVRLKISRDEAEKLKLNLRQLSVADGELRKNIQAAIQEGLESLARLINRNSLGQKLFVSGRSSQLEELAPALGQALGGVLCERVTVLPGQGRSAATQGLQESWERNGQSPLLAIGVKDSRDTARVAQPAAWKWAALAIGLAFVSIALRYAEPWLQKPRLARKLTEIKADREKLPRLDRELSFLQHLKTNQPPYLDALHILATAAPPGTRMDSLSMNRGGDLVLRGTMQNPQQAMDFRSKLIDSGFFSTVVVDEQTPSPDRQKVTVRITAQWKPASARETLPVKPTSARAIDASKPQGRDTKPGEPAAKPNAPPTPNPKVTSPTDAAEPSPKRNAASPIRNASGKPERPDTLDDSYRVEADDPFPEVGPISHFTRSLPMHRGFLNGERGRLGFTGWRLADRKQTGAQLRMFGETPNSAGGTPALPIALPGSGALGAIKVRGGLSMNRKMPGLILNELRISGSWSVRSSFWNGRLPMNLPLGARIALSAQSSADGSEFADMAGRAPGDVGVIVLATNSLLLRQPIEATAG